VFLFSVESCIGVEVVVENPCLSRKETGKREREEEGERGRGGGERGRGRVFLASNYKL
jgi:hypothetical protein